ncbi:MAG: hypothetical protein B1H04_03535 [Planctomycetales bacterium 4484_123]|nr:MAG: hypothetical protein B1H04_03535 [Planctomycetales bacterium 4484_123]
MARRRRRRSRADRAAAAACDAFERWAARYFGDVLRRKVPVHYVDGRPRTLRHVWADGFCPVIYQHRDEAEAFLAVLLGRGLTGTAVEIGLERGGGHMLLRQVCRKVISVERCTYKLLAFARLAPADGRSILICGDSAQRRTVLAVERAAAGPADVLFIDGDHGYQAVRSDYFLYRHLVRPGGVVAFHDTAGRSAEHRDIGILLAQLRRGELDGRRHELCDIVLTGTGVSYEIVTGAEGPEA